MPSVCCRPGISFFAAQSWALLTKLPTLSLSRGVTEIHRLIRLNEVAIFAEHMSLESLLKRMLYAA